MAKYAKDYDEPVQRALEPKRMGLVTIVENNTDCGIHSVMIDKSRGEYVLCLARGKTERDVPEDIRIALKEAAGKTRVVYKHMMTVGHIRHFGINSF